MADDDNLRPSRASVTVTYEDGHTESYHPNKPKFLLAMERKFGVQVPEKHEHMAWLSWHALGRPKDTLEAWLEDVEFIEEDDGSDSDGEGTHSGESDPS